MPPESPAPVVPPAAPLVSLEDAPLSEFMARREKAPAPAPAPTDPPPPTPPIEEPPAPPEPAPTEGDEPDPAVPSDLTRRRLLKDLAKRHEVIKNKDQHISVLESRIAELSAKVPKEPPAPAAPAEPEGAPQLDAYLGDGKTYDDWLRASIRFEAKAELAAERARIDSHTAQQAFDRDVAGYPARVAEATKRHPDFDAVLTNAGDVPVSPVMREICVRHEHGAEMMYWLATHGDAAADLSRLTARYGPEARPLVEQLLIEKMRLGDVEHGASPVVPTTKAPAPITPVGGGSSHSTVPLDEAPLGEFMKRREADLQRRGRR